MKGYDPIEQARKSAEQGAALTPSQTREVLAVVDRLREEIDRLREGVERHAELDALMRGREQAALDRIGELEAEVNA